MNFHPFRHMAFLRLWVALPCCLAFLTACAAGPSASGPGGVISARVTSVSREYRPPAGGQTIRPPQRMADVTTLWMPPTLEEEAHFTSLRASLPPAARTVSTVRAAAWLPPSQTAVMREYLYRLTGPQAHVTRRVLERAARWLPMIRAVFAEQGLPPELACLPLVESAFEPDAVSPAGAAGLWQLMPATARRFGLTVRPGRDERFDPRQSTRAAARYLAWLHGRFGDWPLALAAYNCGEGALDKFLRRCGASTLSDLTDRGRGVVPPETLRFVPQFVAAAAVLTGSGRLGLYGVDLLDGEPPDGGEDGTFAAADGPKPERERGPVPPRPTTSEERTWSARSHTVGDVSLPPMRRVTP